MPRHVPLRRCVTCRASRPKGELVRVVRTPQGAVEIDVSGRSPGRGAYICRQRECIEAAVRRQAVRRALGEALPAPAVERLLQAAQEPDA